MAEGESFSVDTAFHWRAQEKLVSELVGYVAARTTNSKPRWKAKETATISPAWSNPTSQDVIDAALLSLRRATAGPASHRANWWEANIS